MARLTRKLAAKAGKAAREAYEKVETRVLVAEGRKAVKARKEHAVAVGKKAAKAGLVVGGLAAAAVVVREVRKRRSQG